MRSTIVTILVSTLFHTCPSCGKGKIYSSGLKVKDKCDSCGLALRKYALGDGPAFFSMFVSGLIVGVLAILAEIRYVLPFWAHALVWIPITFLFSIYFLKIFKSMLIAFEYRNSLSGEKVEK